MAKNNTEETFYQYYKEGDYFGELALINRRPRQLSVQAVTKCTLVTLTSEVFLSVINRDKANLEIKNKYRDAKPITNARKKKTKEEIWSDKYWVFSMNGGGGWGKGKSDHSDTQFDLAILSEPISDIFPAWTAFDGEDNFTFRFDFEA